MAIQKYKGHLALLGAAIMWGLMSPIGKTALENGISGLSLATFRMTGGAICFWIASIFAPKEQVKPHDLMMLFFAGLLGIVLNQGSRILTVEGLEKNGELDILQKKFIEHGAVQCGFCTPGFLMSAKALLLQKKNPTLEEIKRAVEGNLCRCTGYKKILEAIEDAAKEVK